MTTKHFRKILQMTFKIEFLGCWQLHKILTFKVGMEGIKSF